MAIFLTILVRAIFKTATRVVRFLHFNTTHNYNNHLLPGSVCAELGTGKQAIY